MKKISIFFMMLCLACFGVANAQQNLPYSYGFENNNLATDGWTAQITSTSSGINSDAARTGSYGFRFEYSEDPGYLVSPLLTGAGTNGIEMSFYYKEYSSYYGNENFQVGYTTNASETDPENFTYGAIIEASTSWQQHTETLPAGTVRVAIKYLYVDAFYLYLDDFSFEVSNPCAKPTDLAVTTDGQTATVTWDGTAANNFIVTVNGTPVSGQTSPYTFNVALSTNYEVIVEADCGSVGTSNPVSTSFTTPDCLGGRVIEYTLNDSYGDGWNGNAIQVYEGCGNLIATLTIEDGSEETGSLTLCGDYYEFIWVNGSYASETSFTFTEGGTTLFTKPSSVSDGLVLYTIGTQSCTKPTDLTEANITINSANLSWTGSSDSYVVEYTPWVAAGNDVLPTATMTTYTFPLNGTGTGSVVIRHYDVTNMFRLIVDDIVVKNASGTVIYSQDFETSGGSMPAEFTSIDMDGDGYGWDVVDNTQSYVNGTYGLSSASYNSSVGALYPDNWIILSGIQLGGSISFAARGQDPDFAAEKFCVYVCADADKQQVPAASNKHTLTGLTPFTPYSWDVIGICGGEESCPSFTNIFLTLDDVLVFTTDGDWNTDANWDLGRVPTIADKVRLDADATIPSGYVAYALKIVNTSTGTVTIEDGGQLKMTDNAVVKIQKEIKGYGAGNETDGDHYYFIASPLTESLFSYQSDWAYVNITGNTSTYDLYSFDAEQDLEWLNFNNSANTGDDFTRFYNGWGYLYASEDDYTLEYEGSTAVPSYDNTVVQDFDYAAATGGFKGWKLVGNPFTCNAYLSYVDASNNVLSADFYVMNNDKSYTLLSSDKPLAPCCGAFVSVSATGKIQFSSEAPTSPKGSMLNMNLTQGNTNVDMARIRFGEGANLGKQSFRENSTKLYMTQDNNDYAVVYADNQGEMPVSFKAEKNGTYTLNFSAENAEFSYLHLIDNMTGNEVDLLETPSYSFDAQYTDYASRFKLVFAKGNNDMDSDFAFISDGQIILTGAENGATVQVIDALGRVIAQNDANNTIATDGMSAGVYVIRLINGSNVKTQKIVVK